MIHRYSERKEKSNFTFKLIFIIMLVLSMHPRALIIADKCSLLTQSSKKGTPTSSTFQNAILEPKNFLKSSSQLEKGLFNKKGLYEILYYCIWVFDVFCHFHLKSNGFNNGGGPHLKKIAFQIDLPGCWSYTLIISNS